MILELHRALLLSVLVCVCCFWRSMGLLACKNALGTVLWYWTSSYIGLHYYLCVCMCVGVVGVCAFVSIRCGCLLYARFGNSCRALLCSVVCTLGAQHTQPVCAVGGGGGRAACMILIVTIVGCSDLGSPAHVFAVVAALGSVYAIILGLSRFPRRKKTTNID